MASIVQYLQRRWLSNQIVLPVKVLSKRNICHMTIEEESRPNESIVSETVEMIGKDDFDFRWYLPN